MEPHATGVPPACDRHQLPPGNRRGRTSLARLVGWRRPARPGRGKLARVAKGADERIVNKYPDKALENTYCCSVSRVCAYRVGNARLVRAKSATYTTRGGGGHLILSDTIALPEAKWIAPQPNACTMYMRVCLPIIASRDEQSMRALVLVRSTTCSSSVLSSRGMRDMHFDIHDCCSDVFCRTL